MDTKLIAESSIELATYAGIGVAVGQVTNIFNPAGGALFGVVAFLSGKIIAEGLGKFFGNSSAEKILKIAAEHFGGLYIALVAMVQIGYKIQLAASLSLAMWMIPLTYAATKIALPVIMKQVS